MSKQIEITQPASGYWRATFHNPPINLIDLDTITELSRLVTTLERDSDVKVIVFDSNDPDFFLAHYDVLSDRARSAAMKEGPTGMRPLARCIGTYQPRAGGIHRRHPRTRAWRRQ